MRIGFSPDFDHVPETNPLGERRSLRPALGEGRPSGFRSRMIFVMGLPATNSEKMRWTMGARSGSSM